METASREEMLPVAALIAVFLTTWNPAAMVLLQGIRLSLT